MTSIETYRKAYNRNIEKNEESIKDRNGNFITFEEYLERAKRRIEGQKKTLMGGRRF